MRLVAPRCFITTTSLTSQGTTTTAHMAPSNRAQQNSLAKGVAAWTYVQRPDKSPLRPLVPILRTRWVNDLYKWIGKQDERYPEFIAYGFFSVKGDMVFSTLEQALLTTTMVI